MNNDLINTLEASRRLGLRQDIIRYRCRQLGFSNGQGSYIKLDEDQFNKIKNFKPNKKINYRRKYDKKNILIVEYYLSTKNNSIPNIAQTLELKEYKVSSVINQFLKDGCVTVESKLCF